MRAITTAAICVLGLACSRPATYVKLGEVVLADAEGVVAAEPGPRLSLGPALGAPLPEIPAGAKIVQIAAHRDVLYGEVHDLVQAVQQKGARPVVLVAQGGEARALPATSEAVARSILLEATQEAKACISPPEAEERMCVKSRDGLHIDRAFVRELVRQAVNGYGLTHVHVRADFGLPWIEVVRAVDGARTCCGKGVKITVSIEDLTL